MFENRAIKLINRQLSWLTGSLTCLRAFTRFYALLRAFISVKQFNVFTRFYALLFQLSSLLRLQFTPLAIYRQLNWLTGSQVNSGLHSF